MNNIKTDTVPVRSVSDTLLMLEIGNNIAVFVNRDFENYFHNGPGAAKGREPPVEGCIGFRCEP